MSSKKASFESRDPSYKTPDSASNRCTKPDGAVDFGSDTAARRKKPTRAQSDVASSAVRGKTGVAISASNSIRMIAGHTVKDAYTIFRPHSGGDSLPAQQRDNSSLG